MGAEGIVSTTRRIQRSQRDRVAADFAMVFGGSTLAAGRLCSVHLVN